MGKINVYLPADLERAVREADLSVSVICQAALSEVLAKMDAIRRGREVSDAYDSSLREIIDELRRRDRVSTLDLLTAIVNHSDNLGAHVFAELDVPLPRMRRDRAAKMGFDEDLNETLVAALRVATDMRSERVGTEHVVVAIVEQESALGDAIRQRGVDGRSARRELERLIANPWSRQHDEPLLTNEVLDRLEREVHRLAAELGDLRTQRPRTE